MTPEEFQARYHLRGTSGPNTCTGENPCVASAVTTNGAWYCRECVLLNGRRLWLGGNTDHIVCDLHQPYTNPFPASSPDTSSVG